MKLKHLTGATMMVVSWLLTGSCAIDDRKVSFAMPGLGSGGSPNGAAADSGAGGQSATLGQPGATAAPRLAVDTEAIDLGWVTTGFPVRTRIRVDNAGDAPLAAPTAGCASGPTAPSSRCSSRATVTALPIKRRSSVARAALCAWRSRRTSAGRSRPRSRALPTGSAR